MLGLKGQAGVRLKERGRVQGRFRRWRMRVLSGHGVITQSEQRSFSQSESAAHNTGYAQNMETCFPWCV